MRTTLEQLKSMDNQELFSHWRRAEFPFDKALGCGLCLTQHRNNFLRCYEPNHHGLIEHLKSLNFVDRSSPTCKGVENVYSETILRPNLEELYALRLYYDANYAPEVEPEQEAQWATQQEVLSLVKS